MSAPESSSSKGRPSLLSETAPGAADNSSRILANLEGRVAAQQAPRRRSKKPLVVGTLAVVGLGAIGAWQWQRLQEPARVTAAAQAHGASAVVAAAPSNASGAVASPQLAQGVHGGAASAPAPQAAVIVAEDSSRTAAAGASAPADADANPLTRALTNGSQPAGAAASSSVGASAATAAAGSAKHAPVKAAAAKSRREQRMAAEHASNHKKGRVPGAKDDPDADLLAALVARTKPYDANAPKDASAAKAASAPGKVRPVSLSDRLKQCDKSNFFEAQICRWRVCSDHWGKDPACPSNASAQSN